MDTFDQRALFSGGLEDLEGLHRWFDQLPWPDSEISGKTVQRARLALVEAFSNAVLHAHGGRALPVTVRVARLPAPEPRLLVEVMDRGPGFVLPPAAPPPDDAERGRGLLILRRLAERVVYQNNTLSLWIHSS